MRDAALAAFAREVDRGIEEIFLNDLIDDALFLGLVHLDVAALEHHVERVLPADQTRQTLRAARAGQQSDLDLGQTDFRVGQRNAIIAGEREFETAAERHLFDRGNEGLVALLDRGDHVANRLGLGRRLGAEVVDVGAARELPVRADEHDCRDAGVGRRGLDDRNELAGERERERVDGRVIERDNAHAIVILRGDEGHNYAVTTVLRSSSNASSGSVITSPEPSMIWRLYHAPCVSTCDV